MALTLKASKTFPAPIADVFASGVAAVGALEGKVEASDATKGVLQARFSKTILGRVLGDRSQLTAHFVAEPNGHTTINIELWPLDAVGRRLMFGERKGVIESVAAWWFAHLEKGLKRA